MTELDLHSRLGSVPLSSLLEKQFILGIASVDEFHDALLRDLEVLKDHGREPLDAAFFPGWIGSYGEKVMAHVEEEEDWMLRAGIPAPLHQPHVMDHRRLRRDLKLLAEGRLKRDLNTTEDVYRFLRVELFKHFVQFDAKLTPYAAAEKTA